MDIGQSRRTHTGAILGLLLCTLAGCATHRTNLSVATPPGEVAHPNVILILADDMGYGDLSIQGNTLVSTPHIDSIAERGIRFTDGYVTAPVCSPSRAGLLSGRYPQRFGHEFNPGGRPRPSNPVYERLGLPTNQVLLPQLMKDLGYSTGLVGKWHLGYAPQFLPQSRGFDEYFGFLTGARNYIRPEGAGDAEEELVGEDTPPARAGGGLGSPIFRGTEPVVEDEYLTDAFGREAVDFIQRHREKPFFLYVAFNAVHAPLQATQPYLDRVANIEDRRKRTYAAMTIALDDAVGRILKTLDETQLSNRTLVIFLSDNGGVYRPDQPIFADNGPLRAGKLFVHEGGTRVPFLMQWPGHIDAGTVYRHPVSAMDVLPTVLGIAGGTPPPDRPMDGVNLLPYVTRQKRGTPHAFLAWRLGENRALRKGDWKFLQYGNNAPKLFNLADDIGEAKDLSRERPKKLKKLMQLYAQWESEMIAPVYRIREAIPLAYEGEQINLDF